ncbi:hypothetical protein DHD05_11405 [Arenibacter sp. N53]|nr:hypothetical protein [Arenibacter sp. N53]
MFGGKGSIRGEEFVIGRQGALVTKQSHEIRNRLPRCARNDGIAIPIVIGRQKAESIEKRVKNKETDQSRKLLNFYVLDSVVSSSEMPIGI